MRGEEGGDAAQQEEARAQAEAEARASEAANAAPAEPAPAPAEGDSEATDFPITGEGKPLIEEMRARAAAREGGE